MCASPPLASEFTCFSVGIYVLEEGATDHQKPHTLDEVYYVAGGKAKMKVGANGNARNFDVSPGTIIYVPARVHHSFYDITERLAVLVFFAEQKVLPAAPYLTKAEG
ncbi:MAG: cupin domain-containing protein [Acidobacteria bacterium]|nr:MAG: cupin domain-containing protein [Acidobacteriota bacterium]PYY06813.1 MAG: cupin domain-containing protein [Acidobacteriota bacterium]